MANTTFYLNKSVYSSGDASTSEAVLIVTDDVTVQPGDIVATNAFDVASTLYQNKSPGPSGGSDNLSAWSITLGPAGSPYNDQNLRVFVLPLSVTDFDINGTLANASADAWLDTAQPVQVTVKGAPVASTSPVRFAKVGNFDMTDVKASAQNPFWLSNDTRVFKITAGSTTAVGQNAAHPFRDGTGQPLPVGGGAWNASTAHSFLTSVLAYMNDVANEAEANAIFEALTADEGQSQLTQSQTEGGQAVYNFAIARIHAVNTGVKDLDALVTFRLFSTLNANLAYDGPGGPNYATQIPTVANPVGRVAVVGRLSNNVPFSVPCFGDLRTTGAENTQTDAPNLIHFAKDPGGNTLTRVFYALVHVDINDPTPRFDDGTGQLRTVGDLQRQQHVCTVAEIICPDNPTIVGATPQNSGNLAQRNTSIAYINNPGLTAGTRTIQQNFEFIPRVTEKSRKPNELLFLTRGVPEGTTVELFMPGLDAKKHAKEGHFEAAGDRLRFGIRHAVKLPIDVDGKGRHPALLTVHFPASADVGKEYVIDVLQLDPNTGLVVGAFRLRSDVVKARKTLAHEWANADLAARRAALAKGNDAWSKVLGEQAQFAQRKARETSLEVVRELHEVGARRVAVVLDRIEVPIAREKPMILQAAVYEGGERVATHPVRIPPGRAGTVRVGEVVFEGAMVDHLAVKLLDQTPRGTVVRNARSWKAKVGTPLSHLGARATTESPSPSSWRVWYHVVDER